MKYDRTITLKNGAVCRLRNAEARDGQAVLDIFNLTHGETDYLLSYPDECTFDAAQESRFLAGKAESGNEIEIVAEVNGEIAGTAGIDAIGSQYKLRHRDEFGIGIARKFWGQGIGRALTEACIECARSAGYTQLELSVVAENGRAVALYERLGFVEYGRNPRGFRTRGAGYQALVQMRLEL